MVLLIFIWGSLSETRYIGDWGAPDYEELPNVVLPTWFPNLAPATTINKWVVPLLCAPVGIKNKLHSLLDNAPNYQVGCVIQKGWWNRFYLGGPEWLEVSSWKNNWKENKVSFFISFRACLDKICSIASSLFDNAPNLV